MSAAHIFIALATALCCALATTGADDTLMLARCGDTLRSRIIGWVTVVAFVALAIFGIVLLAAASAAAG